MLRRSIVSIIRRLKFRYFSIGEFVALVYKLVLPFLISSDATISGYTFSHPSFLILYLLIGSLCHHSSLPWLIFYIIFTGVILEIIIYFLLNSRSLAIGSRLVLVVCLFNIGCLNGLLSNFRVH